MLRGSPRFCWPFCPDKINNQWQQQIKEKTNKACIKMNHICIFKRMLNEKAYFILRLKYLTLPRLFSCKIRLWRIFIFQCVLTLVDWASWPGLVDNLSPNFPIFHSIFQITDLDASIKSKLIDKSFR